MIRKMEKIKNFYSYYNFFENPRCNWIYMYHVSINVKMYNYSIIYHTQFYILTIIIHILFNVSLCFLFNVILLYSIYNWIQYYKMIELFILLLILSYLKKYTTTKNLYISYIYYYLSIYYLRKIIQIFFCNFSLVYHFQEK